MEMRIETDRIALDREGYVRITAKLSRNVPYSPVLRLYLPGHLDVRNKEELRHGEQFVELPVRRNDIQLTACGIRRGRGRVRGELFGMYDPDNRCWAASPEIQVG